MSAPHVTGLVAMIMQAAPCLVGDYSTIETILESTATHITYNDGSPLTPTDYPNFASGWGEINAQQPSNWHLACAVTACSMELSPQILPHLSLAPKSC